MSSDKNKIENLIQQNELLVNQIAELKKDNLAKSLSLKAYQDQLVKITHKLDEILIQSEVDHNFLRKIQNLLIPVEVPLLNGLMLSRKFVYGSEIGGDYFDLYEFPDKMKTGILLSSASGYSISSFFLSLMLKISFEQHKDKIHLPSELFSLISNELISIDLSRDQSGKKSLKPEIIEKLKLQSISAFYGVFDRRDFQLEFCLVGSLCAFLATPTGVIKKLSGQSENLNYLQVIQPISCRIELDAKSRLVVLSHGLLDVLTEDDIFEILSEFKNSETHSLRNEIFVRAQIKSGLDQPLRDQTVVVIDIKDRVIKLAKSE